MLAGSAFPESAGVGPPDSGTRYPAGELSAQRRAMVETDRRDAAGFDRIENRQGATQHLGLDGRFALSSKIEFTRMTKTVRWGTHIIHVVSNESLVRAVPPAGTQFRMGEAAVRAAGRRLHGKEIAVIVGAGLVGGYQ